jgi:long-chain acyl-CoA synthetase
VEALYAGLGEQYIDTQVKFEDGRTGSVSATLQMLDAKTFAPVKAAA